MLGFMATCTVYVGVGTARIYVCVAGSVPQYGSILCYSVHMYMNM